MNISSAISVAPITGTKKSSFLASVKFHLPSTNVLETMNTLTTKDGQISELFYNYDTTIECCSTKNKYIYIYFFFKVARI